MAWLEDNFWKHVKKGSDCWIWKGAKLIKGYGQFSLGKRGKRILAHRYSYILHNGRIPEGLEVRHTCDNPSCVRPDHLVVSSHLDNMKDMVKKGRQASGRGHRLGSKTQCPRGHPYFGKNLYIAPDGERGCRACRKENRRKFYEKEGR